jgi:hypothetical protein
MTLPRDHLEHKKTSKTYRIRPLQAFRCSESVSEVRAWGRWGWGNVPSEKLAGWWYTYPSEKSVRMMIPNMWKK